MNIESTTIAGTKKTETSGSSSGVATKDSSSTFKDELEAAKVQDTKTAQAAEATKTEEANTAAAQAKSAETAKTEETAKNNASQQIEKDKLTTQKNEAAKSLEEAELANPLSALNLKIAAINNLKNGTISAMNGADTKIDDKTTEKAGYCQTMKMDNNDIAFFINLTDNQQMSAQNAQLNGQNFATNNAFTEIKSEATQATVQVSATLLEGLNEASKTGKPFRIDFGNDVAVIMKVDKEGVLSANFIPGTAAVEAYLKMNIGGLKQAFDDQNLSYNELAYSKQQKQEQEHQQKKNKENENE